MKTHAQNRGRVNRQRARRSVKASNNKDQQKLLNVTGETARFLEKYRHYLEQAYAENQKR